MIEPELAAARDVGARLLVGVAAEPRLREGVGSARGAAALLQPTCLRLNLLCLRLNSA